MAGPAPAPQVCAEGAGSSGLFFSRAPTAGCYGGQSPGGWPDFVRTRPLQTVPSQASPAAAKPPRPASRRGSLPLPRASARAGRLPHEGCSSAPACAAPLATDNNNRWPL
jgi:hypothetical protein